MMTTIIVIQRLLRMLRSWFRAGPVGLLKTKPDKASFAGHSRQMHDAALQSRHSRLCAVADVETAENDVDVPFDRRFADAESFADLPITAALDDQLQHFQFARAQLRMRRAFRQTLGDRGGNVLQA